MDVGKYRAFPMDAGEEWWDEHRRRSLITQVSKLRGLVELLKTEAQLQLMTPEGNLGQKLSYLEHLHAEVDRCRVCSSFASGFEKPKSMNRGSPGKLMIVGQSPGRTELKAGRAFSGSSGRRLDAWLIASGASPDHPRADVYMTAAVKCLSTSPADFEAMAKNCQPFLARQIMLVRPGLVISLGAHAYRRLALRPTHYADALCQLETSEGLLATAYGISYQLMVWPHPSGLNRWLNDGRNMLRLQSSFDVVRQLVFSDKT
jgi:uracil-DNA glycosylase family 4